MNANELADYLENDFQIQEAVIDMLRQQQAEIEALKNILSEIDRQVFNIELRDDGTMTPVIRMEKP